MTPLPPPSQSEGTPEVERLREALKGIVSGYLVNHTSRWARDEARAALAPTSPVQEGGQP